MSERWVKRFSLMLLFAFVFCLAAAVDVWFRAQDGNFRDMWLYLLAAGILWAAHDRLSQVHKGIGVD